MERSLMRKATGLIAVLLAATLVFSQNKPANKPSVTDTSLPPAAQAALRNVNPENIRQHVRFLSHDLLEGRGTGQRGGDIAAEYIATQFALAGLTPAGENGTYLQKVPMVGVTTLPETTFSLVPA